MDIIFDITKEIQMSSYLGREGLKKYANAILRLINVFCELKTVKFLFEIDLNLELLNRVETAMGSEESLATALSCNTTLSYGAPPLYLVKLDVSIDHQPRFIKENLELLKTNNVACNFELNRKDIFAERVEYIE